MEVEDTPKLLSKLWKGIYKLSEIEDEVKRLKEELKGKLVKLSNEYYGRDLKNDN